MPNQADLAKAKTKRQTAGFSYPSAPTTSGPSNFKSPAQQRVKGGAQNPYGTGLVSSGQMPTLTPDGSGDYYWATRQGTFSDRQAAQQPQQYSTGGGGGYGGGGAAAPQIDMASILKLLGRQPQQYSWQNLEHQDYVAQPYRDFNTEQYDRMRSGITEGLAADAATGQGAYADARTELQQYANPYANRQVAGNTAVPAELQRMLSAQGQTLDSGTQQQGVQADAAFRNVLGLLAGATDQRQASDLRALGGDERRFNESLASEGRTMGLGVDMAQAKAREMYEQEKWQYGEEVARMNYQQRMQTNQYNNQGANQTSQANTGAANEWTGGNTSALIQLLASGEQITPEQLSAFMGG